MLPSSAQTAFVDIKLLSSKITGKGLFIKSRPFEARRNLFLSHRLLSSSSLQPLQKAEGGDVPDICRLSACSFASRHFLPQMNNDDARCGGETTGPPVTLRTHSISPAPPPPPPSPPPPPPPHPTRPLPPAPHHPPHHPPLLHWSTTSIVSLRTPCHIQTSHDDTQHKHDTQYP